VERFVSLATHLWIALLVGTGLQSHAAAAGIDDLGTDGWHAWTVTAVADAPSLCCYSWRNGRATKRHCDLDGHRRGFSSFDESIDATDSMQIYVLMRAGEVRQIRALSSSCPVNTNSEIKDLGTVAPEQSVAWLKPHIDRGTKKSSNAIAAVAVHPGEEALTLLLNTAKLANDQDDREDAIFWLGRTRILESAAQLKELMFGDKNSDIREHAAFSYAQSNATDISSVLTEQGRNDADPDVRSQAWFWLAETGAAESEAIIGHALLHDKNADVREEAVFALAQLPEERAISALATIVEDRKMEQELREQALFWLAQTESEEAFAVIDRLLSNN